MASVTLLPSAIGSDYKYASVANSYQLTNIIGKSSSSSSYGGINLTTGSNAESYFYILFDASEIPASAVIKSISCNVKVYNSSNAINRTGTRNVQLYSESTPKGSAASWTASGSQVVAISNTGSWTRSELDGLRIRCYYKRNTTNSTTSTQVYVQGADITIEYEEGKTYNLTIQNEGFNVEPSSGGAYSEGAVVPITIGESTMPKVTLDGTDITSQFVKATLDTSFNGAPSDSSYNGLQSGTSGVASAVDYTAENPYSGNINWYGSSSATVDSQYAQYTFDLGDIPSDAQNIKVSCKVAGKAESTTYSHQSGGRYSVWALCCNGTEKSEQIYTTSSSVTVLEFSNTGSWTRAELDGLQLRHYVGYYGGSTNGATLTISYTLPSGSEVYTYNLTITSDHVIVISSAGKDTLFVKANGTFKEVSKVYKKTNGTWVEVTDIKALFDGATSGSWSGYFKDN